MEVNVNDFANGLALVHTNRSSWNILVEVVQSLWIICAIPSSDDKETIQHLSLKRVTHLRV